MADVHLGDLLLIKSDGKAGWSLDHLTRQRDRVLEDLSRLLPTLRSLEYGELASRYVPTSEGVLMRLLLHPRQRNLLADPKRGKTTFEGEAERLRAELLALGPIVRREARRVKTRTPRGGVKEENHWHDMLVRRSHERWRITVGDAQLELAFPDCPSYVVDEAIHRLDGVVHSIALRRADLGTEIVVIGSTLWSIEPIPRQIDHLGKLCVSVMPPRSQCPGTLASTSGEAQCGKTWSCLIQLHRCALTGAIVGATACG